jgi:hypothetical protein
VPPASYLIIIVLSFPWLMLRVNTVFMVLARGYIHPSALLRALAEPLA